MKNQGGNQPDWVAKTVYRCDYTPDWDLDIAYRGWLIDSHSKFSYVPVSHDDLSHLLSSLSSSSSTQPSPMNRKMRHPSQSSPHHDEKLTPSTAYSEFSIHCILHKTITASSQQPLSPTPIQSLISRQTMLFSILYIPTITS